MKVFPKTILGFSLLGSAALSSGTGWRNVLLGKRAASSGEEVGVYVPGYRWIRGWDIFAPTGCNRNAC